MDEFNHYRLGAWIDRAGLWQDFQGVVDNARKAISSGLTTALVTAGLALSMLYLPCSAQPIDSVVLQGRPPLTAGEVAGVRDVDIEKHLNQLEAHFDDVLLSISVQGCQNIDPELLALADSALASHKR